MKHMAGCALLTITLVLPAQAQAPVAMLAKELITGIVQTFVKDRVLGMLSSMGPCGMPIGPTGGLATLAGLLTSGGGGLPGMPSMPGMTAGMAGLPDLSALAGAGGLGSLPGAGAAGQVAGLAGGAAQMAELQASMQKMMQANAASVPAPDAGVATDGVAAGSGADEESPPDVAQLMRDMQQSEPLSRAELEELGGLMERLSKAMPTKANPCKPGELATVLKSAADMPMGGGVLRMMLQPLRDMETSVAEARDGFARMSPDERRDYVVLLADDARGWDAEQRDALVGMARTNFLGMPEPMPEQLLARLSKR